MITNKETIDKNGAIGKVWNDYYNGMYIINSAETIIEYSNLLGYFPQIRTDTKDVTILEEQPLDKYLKKLPKGKKIAKGASARKFRGEVISPKGFKLESHQIEYTINNDDMLHPSFNLANEVNAMSLILATDIDNSIRTCAIENAVAVTDPKVKKGWSDGTYADILSDILRIKKTLRDNAINTLDTFMYGDEAITELASKSQVESMRYEFQKTGFYVDDTMDISNARHSFGGTMFDDGELIAFNSQIPALDVIYKNYTAPGVKTVPTIPGKEKITPVVQMLMTDNTDEEFVGQTTIKMGVTVGAYPRANGNKMVRIPNIL